jgi:peroxiredoxin
MKKSILLGLVVSIFALSAHAAKVGEMAPEFELKNANGKTVKLSDFKGKHVVLEWLNHDCPYVKKHYDSGNMQELQKKITADGTVWLSIISSAPGKQGYLQGGEVARITKDKKASPTDVLVDSAGKVGKAYDAKTTPHMYVIDPTGKLVYAGAIDDKPTTDVKDVKGATNYVTAALDALKKNEPVKTSVTKAYGCSVKY